MDIAAAFLLHPENASQVWIIILAGIVGAAVVIYQIFKR
jgi:hypothetical protein